MGCKQKNKHKGITKLSIKTKLLIWSPPAVQKDNILAPT